jgi:hypothetical protein
MAGHALDGLGFGFCLGERGEQQAGQDSDNGDNDQQFDQGKGARQEALAVARRTIGPSFTSHCWVHYIMFRESFNLACGAP